MYSGRERKTKSTRRPQRSRSPPPRPRGLSEAAASEDDVQLTAKSKKKSTREEVEKAKALEKKSKKKKESSDFDELVDKIDEDFSKKKSSQEPDVFVSWDELLLSREALKRRLNTIAAVHGWESSAARKGFLGGIEPARLLASIRAEVAALSPAAAALERADLLLELERVRDRVERFDRRGTEPFEPFEPF